MAQRNQYSIVYLVPTSDQKRYKQVGTPDPEKTLARFQQLNPRATVVRMFDCLTGEDVYASAETFSDEPQAIAKTRSK